VSRSADEDRLSLRIEHALGLSAGDRRAAITAMAAMHDVHRWVARQLADIGSAAHPARGRPDARARPRRNRVSSARH